MRDPFLEIIREWKREIFAFGWNRTREPLRVCLLKLSRRHLLRKNIIHERLESSVALCEHQAVVDFCVGLGEERQSIRIWRSGLEACEKDIVLHESSGSAGIQHQERLGVIFRLHDVEAQVLL